MSQIDARHAANAEPPGAAPRRQRSRRLVAICVLGLAATGLSQNLMLAGADDRPVPGERISSGPDQITLTAPSAPGRDDGAQRSDPARDTPAPTAGPSQGAAPSATPTGALPAPAVAAAPGAAHPMPKITVAPGGQPATNRPPSSPARTPGEAPHARRRAKYRCITRTTRRGLAVSKRGADQAGAGGVVTSAAHATSARTGCRAPTPLLAGAAAPVAPDGTATAPIRNAAGLPTTTNPTMSLALPGPAPVGVPNFFIDKFRIPPFLLPIYQAAGTQYGIRWEALAAINEIETDYGRNLNVSSAGALGWMQFMPSTWRAYGVDANRDGKKDPYNPVDAIFAAARYLRAAGGDKDLRKGIFAYNHADWYVQSVLMRARMIGGLPTALVGSLTGLTQGRFPVYATARYADDLTEGVTMRRVRAGANAALPIESSQRRRSINVYARTGSPVIAVQDGRIVGRGQTRLLGRFVRLRDAYGNTYTYSHLGSVAARVPAPKAKSQSPASIAHELALPKADPRPMHAATAGRQVSGGAARKGTQRTRPTASERARSAHPAAAVAKERLFAHPDRRNAYRHGGRRQLQSVDQSALPEGTSVRSYMTGTYGLRGSDVVLKPLRTGRRVIAGTILGRVGALSSVQSPHLVFEIRPAGRGAPRIDPKPILDGWKLLESTAIYRARGKNALLGPDAPNASIGEILLMSKEALAQRVLANPRIEIYSCGRRDIEAGIIDRRVLATLEFLAGSGLKPTVTSLNCGHGYYTAGGNVSEHSSGSAVDIAKVNGIPILGHQGEGTITDITIRRLLTLQGTMKPHQIISLMKYGAADNTLALPDHADHIHVGFRPEFAPGSRYARELDAVLRPAQWIKLIDRLGRIDNPTVRAKPSRYAIPAPVMRASGSHQGE